MTINPSPHHWDGRAAAGLPNHCTVRPCTHTSMNSWTAAKRDRSRRPFRLNRPGPGGLASPGQGGAS